ncbi:MAG: diaminopimelate epimerase [Proteobacteria bacterium]|nr:diaminopimelate epimerase [Pseudomonadota bacterium]NOG60179.1 diaminopimelate epimerase [Pseudomonadota bacterium]
MEQQFTKMHGIGNDFVVFDTFSKPLTLSREQIRHIADRQFGIGCDQVLLLEPPQGNDADVRYRIFNADGGEVMQCGNGARCAAVYLKDKGLVTKSEIVAETGAGQLILKINEDGRVTVNMGVPQFEPAEIPMQADEYSEQYTLILGEEEVTFGAVSMSNPHAVIIVDNVDIAPVDIIGPAMQSSELFPESVNVGFIQILNNEAFKLRVYERGSGETLACGSGACAAMVIACQQGYLEGTIDAELRGGNLNICWAGEGEPVFMTGPATTVFEGKVKL